MCSMYVMLQYVIDYICHFCSVLVRSHPAATGAEWKNIFSFISQIPLKYNMHCLFTVGISSLNHTNHTSHKCHVSYTMMYTWMHAWLIVLWYTPMRGVTVGGCNENAFCNATLVFMQSPTENKTMMKLLAAGGTNGQESCVALFFFQVG